MTKTGKFEIKKTVLAIVAGICIAAIGASAKAIIDVNVLKAQRVEDVKHIGSNGEKIDKLQTEMNNNFKTVIKLLNHKR